MIGRVWGWIRARGSAAFFLLVVAGVALIVIPAVAYYLGVVVGLFVDGFNLIA